jgi:hypothetical protein
MVDRFSCLLCHDMHGWRTGQGVSELQEGQKRLTGRGFAGRGWVRTRDCSTDYGAYCNVTRHC